MKLRKILATAMAAAMLLSNIPAANLTVSAAESDILTSNYGYQNIDLVASGDGQNVTVTTGSEETANNHNNYAVNVLDNNNDTAWHTKWSYDSITAGENWIAFQLNEAKTVAGVLYKINTNDTNGILKRAKVEVSTDNGTTYEKVYETSATNVFPQSMGKIEMLFTPVENVTNVKVTGLSTYGSEPNKYVMAREMRLITTEDTMLTATAGTTNETLGTATVDIQYGSGKSSIQVVSGVPVVYTAKLDVTAQFKGWKVQGDENNTIVSTDNPYTVTLEENKNLVAVFENGYTRIDIPTEGGTLSENPSNIRASSDRAATSNTDMDGRAWYAFDRSGDNANTSTHWHSDYTNQSETSPGKVRDNNPIWIEAGFKETKNVSMITYQPRQNAGVNSCCAKKYQVLVAYMDTPTDTPTDEDFALICEGTLTATKDVQKILFPVTVRATHVRLKVLSTQTDNDFITASNIEMFEKIGETDIRNILDTPTAKVAEECADMGTVSKTATKVVENNNNVITLTAEANSGYVFEKWVEVNGETRTIVENEDAAYEITVDANSAEKTYEAYFVRAEDFEAIEIAAGTMKANSWYGNTGTSGDGPATFAFDFKTDGTANIDSHWHSNYSTVTNENVNGVVSSTNPIWIEAGFGKQKTVKLFAYQTRKDGNNGVGQNCAKQYQILAANMENPSETPSDNDYTVVVAGEFKATKAEQIISLPSAVKATHIRLKVFSVYSGDYVTASNIRILAPKDASDVFEEQYTVTTKEGYYPNADSTNAGEYTAFDSSEATNTYAMGQLVTVNATEREGYAFKYWQDVTDATNKYIVSTEKDYSFVPSKNIVLNAVYTATANVNDYVTITVKTAKSFSGKAICAALKLQKSEVSGTFTLPGAAGVPSYVGYEFVGYATAEGAEATITPSEEGTISVSTPSEDTTYIALYKATESNQYTVTVENGTIKNETETTFPMDKLVTVVANEAAAGKKFANWTVDGKVVSTRAEYSFYLKNNVTIKANYVSNAETEVAEPSVAFVLNSRVVESDKTKANLGISWDAPEGYEVLSEGIIRTYNSDYSTRAKLTLENVSTEGANIKQNTCVNVAQSGNYSVTVKLSDTYKTQPMYARGYITYRKDNKVYVKYTDVITNAAISEGN